MLKSERVTLGPIVQSDLSSLLKWINDRELVIFNAPYKPISEVEHQSWFASVVDRDDVFLFGVRLQENGDLVGYCQLNRINYIHRTGELQIRLGDRSKWGMGYGTEALLLLLKFGFKDLNLNRIYLHVLATNSKAIHVYEKVGFVREGLLREAAHIDGSYVDIVVMGILKRNYDG